MGSKLIWSSLRRSSSSRETRPDLASPIVLGSKPLYVRPDNYIETKETTLGSSAASCAGLCNGFMNTETQLVCRTMQIFCTPTLAHKPCIALRFPAGSSLYIVQMFRVFQTIIFRTGAADRGWSQVQQSSVAFMEPRHLQPSKAFRRIDVSQM